MVWNGVLYRHFFGLAQIMLRLFSEKHHIRSPMQKSIEQWEIRPPVKCNPYPIQLEPLHT